MWVFVSFRSAEMKEILQFNCNADSAVINLKLISIYFLKSIQFILQRQKVSEHAEFKAVTSLHISFCVVKFRAALLRIKAAPSEAMWLVLFGLSGQI